MATASIFDTAATKAAPPITPAAAAAAKSAPAPAPATSPATPKHSANTIQDFIKSSGFVDASGNVTNAHGIYSNAQKYGVNGEQLDQAMGWSAGTADKWVTDNGFTALGQPKATALMPTDPVAPPKPATTPAKTPVPNNGVYADSPSWGPGGPNSGGSSIYNTASKAVPTPASAITNPATGPAAAPAPAAAAPAAGNVVTATNAPTYTPVDSKYGAAAQTTFDEANSAAGRLNTMLTSGSPLMETARLRGNQQSAARGMLGSSMGVEAAQKAMIESASPFAIADANNAANISAANTAQMNDWNKSDLQRQQGDAQFGAGLTQSYDKMAQDNTQFGQSLAENARQANLQASTQMSVAGMQYDIADKRLSQEDRQFVTQMGLEQKKVDAAMQQFQQQFGLDVTKLSQQDKQYYDGLQLEKNKLDQQAEQFNKDWTNKFSLESMAQTNRIDLANIDAQNRKDLVAVEAQYKSAIAGNENISNAWGTTMAEIGRIQNNPDLEAAAKTTLINNTLGSFKSFTGFWQKINGGTADVSSLLNFNVAGTTAANASGVPTGAQPNYVDAGGD
jgi:hypothetical protein